MRGTSARAGGTEMVTDWLGGVVDAGNATLFQLMHFTVLSSRDRAFRVHSVTWEASGGGTNASCFQIELYSVESGVDAIATSGPQLVGHVPRHGKITNPSRTWFPPSAAKTTPIVRVKAVSFNDGWVANVAFVLKVHLQLQPEEFGKKLQFGVTEKLDPDASCSSSFAIE